jgi:hypothetical protein
MKVHRGVVLLSLILAGTAAPRAAWGQWTTGSGGTIFYTGGNVGIGTSNPSRKLDVSGGVSLWGHLDLWNGDSGEDAAGITSWNAIRFYSTCCGFNSTDNYGILFNPRDGSAIFKGNVGIGTTNPQSKLAVNGNITAQDVMVTNTGWSDYVFQPGYRLRPLREIGAYIRANHHLPDIPSEAEVKEKGVSVGEMQAKLLAKIEELTLHMIRQEEENRELRERIARLEKGATAK